MEMIVKAIYVFDKEEEAIEFIDDVKASGEITSGKTDALYEKWSTLYREHNITAFPCVVTIIFKDLGGYEIEFNKSDITYTDEVSVEEKKDDPEEAIDWDKVKTFAKFFLIGGVCYILGKKGCRYKTLKKPLNAIKIMSSDGMDDKEIDAVNRFIFHLNDMLNKEHLAIVRDKKWRKR